MTNAIEAEGLVKRFGKTTALDGIDLTVPAGKILGMLGPNGAGKTTAVRILATLLRPDAGWARVAGYDVVKQSTQVRSLVGLTGQYASLDEDLSATENLMLLGRLLGLSKQQAKVRSAELLERFELTDAAKRAVKTYSGGMRRRADLAASLVGRPDVLYLDEPTTGLDPHSRNEVWDIVRMLVGDGVTVLLTTQYLDEADQLADLITVVDHGRIIADRPSRRAQAAHRRPDVAGPPVAASRHGRDRGDPRRPGRRHAGQGRRHRPAHRTGRRPDAAVRRRPSPRRRRHHRRRAGASAAQPRRGVPVTHRPPVHLGHRRGPRPGREQRMTAASVAVPRHTTLTRRGPIDALRDSLVLAGRSIVKIRKNPETLLDVTLQPILFLFMFVYLFGGAIAGNTHDYLQLLMPGLMVQNVAFASMGTGTALNTDISKGVFDRFQVDADRPVGAVGRRGPR